MESSVDAGVRGHRSLWRARRTRPIALSLMTLLFPGLIDAQTVPHPFDEGFDTSSPPTLPAGWSASSSRDPDGDFSLSTSGAFSAPGCAVSSNAEIAQTLTSPPVDLGEWRGSVLRWMERRSATHDATMALRVSTDGGSSFVPIEGGEWGPPGVTTYVERRITLPDWLESRPGARFRWAVSADGSGSTGTIRLDDISLSGQPRFDISLGPLGVSPGHPLAGEEIVCNGFVVNTGFGDADQVRLSWALDLDGDGTPDQAGSEGSIDIGLVLPGDSAEYEFTFVRPGQGPLTLYTIVASGPDMVPANDTASMRFGAATAPLSVVINEIMYDPIAEKAEYVELFNRTGDTINLGAWRLTDDEDDSTGGRLVTADLLLEPGGYLLCSPDSALTAHYPEIPDEARVIGNLRGFSLNNDGDLLILSDESGGTIDRLDYLPEWHTPALDETRGRSLERIDPANEISGPWNWGTSAGGSGGTPGYRNSLAANRVPTDDRLRCDPNPFSPDGDGIEDVTLIGYRLGGGPVIARVRIYDREGRPVRTLVEGVYAPGTGSFAWNGYDDAGRKAPIGVYVVLLDAVDGSGVEAMSLRGVVVVAGRL